MKPYWYNEAPRIWKLATCCMFDSEPLDSMNMGTCTLTSAKKDPMKAINKAFHNAGKLVEIMKFLSLQPRELRYFRISSELFPCYTAPEMTVHYATVEPQLREVLRVAGQIAKENEIRLSSHPAQFTVLASKDSDVVKRSIDDIHYHALIFEMMGIEPEHGIVNIHLQGRYDGTHDEGIKRFATNFKHLNDYSKRILTVENEDKPNGYDIVHVLKLADKIGIRAMFDTHHYACHRKDLTQLVTYDNPLFQASLQTWGTVRPAIHVSQSGNPKRLLEHSQMFDDDTLKDNTMLLLYCADIEMEFKSKWTAVTDYYNYVTAKTFVLS